METVYSFVLYDFQNRSSYPHKHVQFVLTSLFQLLDLCLARVADVQMIDSWATSIPNQQRVNNENVITTKDLKIHTQASNSYLLYRRSHTFCGSITTRSSMDVALFGGIPVKRQRHVDFITTF